MRKILSAVILVTVLFPLSAVTYAYDPEIGLLCSGNERILSALKENFSVEWVEEYVSPSSARDFTVMYGSLLPAILPLENVLMSVEDEGALNVKDTAKGILMTVYIDEDGQIESLSVIRSALPADPAGG